MISRTRPSRPTSRPATYSRADPQSRFEAVNVYYAITEAQKKIQALGFTDVNNRAIDFTVNIDPQDNSNYNSLTKALTFGAGGVDDAEDSEVVLHEYGHSIQDDQVPGFGSGDEQGAMGEGFGDFFAGMFYLDKGNARHEAAAPLLHRRLGRDLLQPSRPGATGQWLPALD